MKRAAMADIETLSSQNDAAIIAIGLCVFDEKTVFDSTEILIDPKLAPGHRDPKTLEWWNGQDPDVFRKMMSGHLTPWAACDQVELILDEWEVSILWANPPSFDIVIMRHLFDLYGKPFPIHYTNERDFRTLRKFADDMGIDYREPYEERTAHDAESDAICQAQALQIILRDLALV